MFQWQSWKISTTTLLMSLKKHQVRQRLELT